MRAIVYYRVSSPDQTTEHQKHQCEEYCRAKGWQVTIVEETGKRWKQRAGWREVMKAARARRCDVLVVWALDRIGGLWGIADAVRELDRLGVRIVSLEDSWIDQGEPMIRDLLVRVFDWIAGWELRRLSARTKAAHETARKRGKRIGRPRVLVGAALDTAVALRLEGKSWGEIQKAIKRLHAKDIEKSTIASAVTRLQEAAA